MIGGEFLPAVDFQSRAGTEQKVAAIGLQSGDDLLRLLSDVELLCGIAGEDPEELREDCALSSLPALVRIARVTRLRTRC